MRTAPAAHDLSLRGLPRRPPSRSERVAGWLLVLRGHRVLAHRLRTPPAEVDLVCRQGRTLVLVEVKLRRHDGRGGAAEAIGPRQSERLCAAAEWLLARSDWALDVRIDLVAFDGLRVRHVRHACAP